MAASAAMRMPVVERPTYRRAMMLTSRVSTNSTSPAANNADRYTGVEAASPNSLAITADSV